MTNEKIESNPIVRQTLEFALVVNKYTAQLRKENHWDLAKQLFRSGTSIGANVWEAQNSESKADFVHKMKIAAKECNETLYWLLLCSKSEGYPECHDLLLKLASIQKMLSAIISTSKKDNPIRFLIGHLFFHWKPVSACVLANDYL